MQKEFPSEVLTKIYNELSLNDIRTCMSVCHAWHGPAKRQFYDVIEFKTSISISLFNYCLSQSKLETLPMPGLCVKKVILNDDGRTEGEVSLTLTEQHIHTLFQFCPTIEFIECSSDLNPLVHAALLSLPYPLPLLRSIPSQGPLYMDCARKFCRSLEKISINVLSDDYQYLRSFTSLSVVDVSDKAVEDIYVLIDILNLCPQLVELKALVVDTPSVEERHLQNTTPFSLEKLDINVVAGKLSHVAMVYELLDKLKQLKYFELSAEDILDAVVPDENLDELALVIQSVSKLENGSITVYGEDYNKGDGIAQRYIDAAFQPSEKQWDTSLIITNNNVPGYATNEALTYEISSENNEKLISILMPSIESEDRGLHMDYVSRFALGVNDLLISYEGTPFNQNGCDYFLETVIQECQRLHSLTLTNGNYNNWERGVVNANLYRISLISSFLSPTFFYTLSQACPNLKRLEIYKCHTAIMNDMIHYHMPDTSLEEIAFNLDQFKLSSFSEQSSVILKVILKARQKQLYYYTKFEHTYMTQLTKDEGEKVFNSQDSLSVVMEFNDVQKIRATYFGIPDIEINTTVVDKRF